MAYNKYTWQNDEIITADKLNHMEDGISDASGGENLEYIKNDPSSQSGIIVGMIEDNYEIGGRNSANAFAFAQGMSVEANGISSHAEGDFTTASGRGSHAEGYRTTASGEYSHAEGYETAASGKHSHAEGQGTLTARRSQHVIGEFNIKDTEGLGETARGKYVMIVGNGTSTNRSNAFAMKWDGTFVFADGTEITPAQFASLLALLN